MTDNSALVVQHNALVNARFDLNTTEARLFLAMLAAIRREDDTFTKVELRVRDVLEISNSQNYTHIKGVLEKFATRLITVETLSVGQTRRGKGRQRKYSIIPLLSRADYLEGEGTIALRFNDELRDYLLQLSDNFTRAQLTELMKLKSASSYRLYWLLREHATFGSRTIELAELKQILGLSEEYDRFSNFRVRVLERARQELARTDLPFSYELLRTGRVIDRIRFTFGAGQQRGLEIEQTTVVEAGWRMALRDVGISEVSLPVIATQLERGIYDEGYIRYVLVTVTEEARLGKIKRVGGAVYKALTDGYLLADYQLSKTPAKRVKTRATRPAANALITKLTGQLEDARKSVAWVREAVIYTDETRAVALIEAQANVAKLEAELAKATQK